MKRYYVFDQNGFCDKAYKTYGGAMQAIKDKYDGGIYKIKDGIDGSISFVKPNPKAKIKEFFEEFYEKISKNMVDADPKFSETVDKHFWELSNGTLPMQSMRTKITVFNRQEIFELNEWIRKKRGTYEDLLRRREIDRRISEEADEANQTDA